MFLVLFVIAVTLTSLRSFSISIALLFALAVLIWFSIGSFLLMLPSFYIGYFLRRPPNRKLPNYEDLYREYAKGQTGLVKNINRTLLYCILLIVVDLVNPFFILPSFVGIIVWTISDIYTTTHPPRKY